MVYMMATNAQQLIYTATGTTSTAGALTFTLPAAMFTTITSVQASVVRDSATPATAAFAMVRTFNTSTVVVQVFESRTIILGGGEGLEATTTATTVHLAVFGT